MPSNCLLGWPTIQSEATGTSNLTASTSRPLANLFGKSRPDRFEIATASTTNLVVTYDLGASTTKTANFIAIMRAKLLKKNYCSAVKLYGNSVNVLPGAPLQTATITGTLMGPNSEDYFMTFTETSAYRYWFIEFVNTGTASTYPCASVIFGKALDLGREPMLGEGETIQVSLTRENAWSREARHQVTLKFAAVSDTNIATLTSTLLKNQDVIPLCLIDLGQYFLNATSGMHCHILDHDITPYFGVDNDVTITFEEEI